VGKIEKANDIDTVLVTGAGGYIGTTLVPQLLEAGYRVRALDRFFFGRDLLPLMRRWRSWSRIPAGSTPRIWRGSMR